MPEQLVEVNGIELCADVFGDPSDPAVLLIHGTGSSMLSWHEELCERLAAGGRLVIRYDARDAGRSTTSPLGAPPYTLRHLVADAIGLLDRFGASRGHLVGMSGGAAVAQLAALDHQSRVTSLTSRPPPRGYRARRHAISPHRRFGPPRYPIPTGPTARPWSSTSSRPSARTPRTSTRPPRER
jgi:pimeloyl-ACP methyl ester carboxylesterase